MLHSAKKIESIDARKLDRRKAHRALSKILDESRKSGTRVTGVLVVVTNQDENRNSSMSCCFDGFFENVFEMVGALEMAKGRIVESRAEDEYE